MKKKIKAPKSVKEKMLKIFFIGDLNYDVRWYLIEAYTPQDAFQEFVWDMEIDPSKYENYMVYEINSLTKHQIENKPGFVVKEF